MTGDADRIRATAPQRGAGRRGRSSPGARRPSSDRRHYEALAERGWLLSEDFSRSGVLAGIVAALALAAPALGAPANVTVRVEGDGGDARAARRRVTTTTAPVARDGARVLRHERARRAGRRRPAATGAARASTPARLDRRGRSRARQHVFPDYYWRSGSTTAYSDLGLCGAELQEGDDVLVVPAARGPDPRSDRRAARRSTAGQAVTVTVTEHGVRRTARSRRTT